MLSWLTIMLLLLTDFQHFSPIATFNSSNREIYLFKSLFVILIDYYALSFNWFSTLFIDWCFQFVQWRTLLLRIFCFCLFRFLFVFFFFFLFFVLFVCLLVCFHLYVCLCFVCLVLYFVFFLILFHFILLLIIFFFFFFRWQQWIQTLIFLVLHSCSQ